MKEANGKGNGKEEKKIKKRGKWENKICDDVM